jgi:Zn-dependent peptidase ImmA (M78 family)
MAPVRSDEELKLWRWLEDNYSSEPHGMGIEDLKRAVKKALFTDAEKLVEKTGQTIPPIIPEIVARERKVIEIERALLDTDALIVPCKGGFLMKIDERLPAVRKRFACAHEIGHTYFFDIRKDPPFKPYRRSSSRYWVEDGICYEIARRILMPTIMIKDWIDDAFSPYIDDFMKMMDSFFVSGELVAHRIQDLNAWDVLILIFKVSNNGIFLYKVLKTGDDMDDIHVGKRGLKVSDPVLHDLIIRAYKGDVGEENDIDISIGNLKGKIDSIGVAYIGSYPPKVIAILKGIDGK